jgi:hypothetical protein
MARPQHALEAVKGLRSITIAPQLEHGFISRRDYQNVEDSQVLCPEADSSSKLGLK